MLLPVLGICSLLLPSCSSDDGGTPTPGPSDNALVYNGVQSKIESVVYTVDEQKVYTFYFSPTQGLVDLDAMLLADDYMKISTTTPTGNVDLLSASNSLVYKKVNISSAAADNVEKATLSLQLTSLTTAKMNLDVTLKSGETLQAGYNGTCIKQQGQQQGDVYDVTLTNRIFGYYMGPDEGNAGTDGYYAALTNAEFEVKGTQFSLTSEGYAIVVNFYGTQGETWKNMPTGSFFESGNHGDHTFDGEYSGVYYRDADGKMQLFTLLDPVKISRDQAGIVTLTASFLDKNYEEHTLVYQGELPIGNGTLNVAMPQIERDIVIEGAYAQAVYNGDIMENGTGLTEITIYDQKAENSEPNAYAMKIAVFAEKFTNPKVDRRLIPGTYKAADTYAQFTWMKTVEVPIMGIIIPMGTYGAYDNGTQQGEYAYAVSGDIVIRQGSSKTHYTIEFDLQSIAGYSIRGSYTGEIYLEDQSSDNENDGTSSLKDDYELNFDYLKTHGVNRADCYPQSEIWVRGLGTVPVSTACDYSGREYGFQHIVIGSREIYEITDEYPLGGGWDGKGKGKLVESDMLGIDLLVKKGDEEKIAPGIYSITPERYPAHFYPGVCVRGYNCYYGTSMTFTTSAIGYGYPAGYFDPEYTVQNGWLNIPTFGEFASIYSGTITVEKADGGDNWYTITVDGRDVLKHRITGSWTGPIYLAGSDTPVVQSGVAEQAAARRHFPSFREIQSRNGGKLPLLTSRQIYR